jgi:hypothetical protein
VPEASLHGHRLRTYQGKYTDSTYNCNATAYGGVTRRSFARRNVDTFRCVVHHDIGDRPVMEVTL